MKLVLATRNEHKRAEFARLLAPHEIEALPEDAILPPETGATFAENAMTKARAGARATGRATIADDSGIEAASLDGRPGVRSARFAGEDATDEENLAKLRREAPAGSGLAYACVLAYADACGTERLFEGRCAGVMAETARGRNGFGYDPVFVPEDADPDDSGERPTMAELPPDDKDAISHRGRAARSLKEWLPA